MFHGPRLVWCSGVRPTASAACRFSKVLLEQRRAPVGICLPTSLPAAEVVAVIRSTRGNFRLLVRLLAQMERAVTINGLEQLSPEVVETARDNLVIGQA